MVYIFTFILAFCSIVYELLLGQTLSVFLGDTVLRYSVTIGLYMMSMGIGAFLAGERFIKDAVLMLQRIELLLTIFGAASIIFLFLIEATGIPEIIFSTIAHLLIVIIGILTGLEIPLLIQVKKIETPDSKASVLGIDYLGAVLGTLVFAFFFYPQIGLIPTAFFAAILNAMVGLLLITQKKKVKSCNLKPHKILSWSQGALLIILIICLLNSSAINEFCLNFYLNG